MKLIRHTLLLAGFACYTLPIIHAQEVEKTTTYQVKIDVDKPEFDDLESPDPPADTREKVWRQKDWLEMEVKFEIEAIKPEPRDKTLPKLTIKWFIVALDPTQKQKSYILLEKEVEHVNVPVGDEIYASCYISPSGVRRLSNGGDRASKNIIFGVGGELYVEGQEEPVAFFTSKKDTVKVDGRKLPFWYAPNLAASTSVQILDKSETPFQWLWWDRYAEIAPKEAK